MNRLWQIATVVFMLTIYWTSSQPAGIEDPAFYIANLDKLLHFFAYLILGLWLRLGIYGYFTSGRIRIIISLTLGILYGGFDELHQMYVPSRVADIIDWLADILGTFFGVFIGSFLIKDMETVLDQKSDSM